MSSLRWKVKLAKYRRLDGADKRLLLRAIWSLAIARIQLLMLSFRRLATGQNASGATPDPELLARIGLAVAVAANNVPWRSDCFPQTLAARRLLKRHGITSTIHIGVERLGDDILNGHAWLTCGDTIVTGGADLDRYTELL